MDENTKYNGHFWIPELLKPEPSRSSIPTPPPLPRSPVLPKALREELLPEMLSEDDDEDRAWVRAVLASQP